MNLNKVSLSFFTLLTTNPILNNFFEIKELKTQLDDIAESKLFVYVVSEDKIYVRNYIINMMDMNNKTFLPVDASLLSVIQSNLLNHVSNFNPLLNMFNSGANPFQNLINPNGIGSLLGNLSIFQNMSKPQQTHSTTPLPVSNISSTPTPTPLPDLSSSAPAPLPLPDLSSSAPAPLPLPDLTASAPTPLPLPDLTASTPTPLPLPDLSTI